MTSGYSALRRGTAIINCSKRGKLAVRGADRARIVHALATNSVDTLAPGEGCYAFFLNAQGKILGDANVFCLRDELLIDTEPEAATTLLEHIDRHIIADDATVHNLSGELTTLSVEGPDSERVLEQAGIAAPSVEFAIAECRHGFAARTSITGQPGCLLFVRREHRAQLMLDLTSAGAYEATADDVRTVRIENGKPRFGEEITGRFLGPEVGQDRAIHPQKGCYLGQEVVERVRSRGLLARVLLPVFFRTSAPPAPGTKLFSGDLRAGEIVSAVYSPKFRTAVGMAYIRVEAAREDIVLTCGSGVVVARTAA